MLSKYLESVCTLSLVKWFTHDTSFKKQKPHELPSWCQLGEEADDDKLLQTSPRAATRGSSSFASISRLEKISEAINDAGSILNISCHNPNSVWLHFVRLMLGFINLDTRWTSWQILIWRWYGRLRELLFNLYVNFWETTQPSNSREFDLPTQISLRGYC